MSPITAYGHSVPTLLNPEAVLPDMTQLQCAAPCEREPAWRTVSVQVQARGARGSDEAHYQRAYRVVGASTVGGGANAADALLTGLPRLADEPFIRHGRRWASIHMVDGGLAGRQHTHTPSSS